MTQALSMSLSGDPFLLLLQAHGVPAPETEVVFAPPRKWRADYCWQPERIIVEREGGVFAKGRAGMAHATPTSIVRDMAKQNAAVLLGYRYLRYTPQQLASGEAVEAVKQLIASVPSPQKTEENRN